ncbi:MAG TPA: anti-sigma factor [Mycobacteriales bacterium]|nr:anti-sigma factor [Mycobacteriales bacterium]
MSPARGGEAHALFEELAVGYALHALEPQDEVRFTAHLASCAACERAVHEHVDTLAQLAYAAPAAEPPPAVLEGIRAAVRADADADAGAALPQPAPGVADLSTARRRRDAVVVRRSWLLSGAAAAVALVLGLGAWNVVLQNDRDEQAARGDRLASVVETLERPDTRTVRLADFDGRVRAVVVAHGQQMSLVVDGLDRNPEDTVYVLWGQNREGDVRALSTFDVTGEDLDVLRGMPLQVPVEDLTALMVTHEEGRTAPERTEQPVVVAGSV